jgi:ribosomal protein S18 acetylase RimI-like enzyme
MYPLLYLGIQEDLRSRLRSNAAHQVCLVAVKPLPTAGATWRVGSLILPKSTQIVAGTVEIGLRTQPPWHFRHRQYPYLSNLAVQAEYRRLGIAHQLLLSCERIALEWGYKDLYLHVLENNYPARHLYTKLGYQVEEVETSWKSWLFGQPRQLFLHKRLG